MSGEKTEKATPKRKEEARKKGQVARSADLNGAVVLLAGLLVLKALGGRTFEEVEASMVDILALMATPDVVSEEGLPTLFGLVLRTIGLAVAPIAFGCMVAGVAVSVAQVGFKPSGMVLKPDFKKLDPLKGAKNIFGQHALFESIKTVLKFVFVGGIAALAVFPALPELAALVGYPPAEIGARLVDEISSIAIRAVAAYLVIAAADLIWQRYRYEKQLKMSMQEIKEEMKSMSLPAEVRGAIRRRQMQAARNRMMADVPHADVVVTNPTQFAVALKYDGAKVAPEVVAKGKDLIAMQIRRLAEENGVPVIADPPLARSLHESVEVGHEIPADFYEAVAQLLAFVYRVAGRRAA